MSEELFQCLQKCSKVVCRSSRIQKLCMKFYFSAYNCRTLLMSLFSICIMCTNVLKSNAEKQHFMLIFCILDDLHMTLEHFCGLWNNSADDAIHLNVYDLFPSPCKSNTNTHKPVPLCQELASMHMPFRGFIYGLYIGNFSFLSNKLKNAPSQIAGLFWRSDIMTS